MTLSRGRKGPKFRLFPKQGYVLLMVGILVGFLIFLAVSFTFVRVGPEEGAEEGMPSSIEFEFLYTSEKQSWIEEVTLDFEGWFRERFGVDVHVKLTVGGTHETVNLILWKSVTPVVWSPASSIWIPYINMRYGEDIAAEWVPLVLSPVVIACWGSFLQKYNVTSFRDLYQLTDRGVSYKYGHPDPLLSNGGTMAVVLQFAEAAGKKPEELVVDDFENEAVLDFVRAIESRAVAYGKSTGFFGTWAAESGPSTIDCFSVYESVVLDNALKAKKKWNDPIVAVYPRGGTLLSDHPFVILNAPWVTRWQRFAATQYLYYLLSEESQSKAQKHGFRPANPSVPLDPDIFSEENGVQYEIRVPVLRALTGEAMEALFTVWTDVKNPGV
ncbi:MAG: extracellular solute-binding protein [Candidatus Bathyarchaeia archaeon]